MLTKLGMIFVLAASICIAQTFRLTDIVVTSQTPQTGVIFIGTTGTPTAQIDLANVKLWRLTVNEKGGRGDMELNVQVVTLDSQTGRLAVKFDAAGLAGLELQKAQWTATFDNHLQATSTATNSGSFFSPAKSKDDADLYVFGSYLAGVGTKPLYSIDAKMNWVPEIKESGYFFGVESAILVNSGVDAPVSRTRIDPDSISAALSVQREFNNFVLDINPVKGEFSRQFPASDIVTAATLKWVLPPATLKNAAFVFYPLGGYEVGSNLNKPSVLFKEPVNLSGYDTIARSLVGAHSALMILKKSPSSDSAYRLSVQADYIGRLPFEREPFVTSAYVNGVRANVTSLGTNMRHYVESSIVYNITDLLGLEVKYRYGSLPPLFEFVDHQITVGITFKSKLPRTFRN